jgi:2-oxoglutarate/2-oxoacid ferredoxin oxidoreductase subunit beta
MASANANLEWIDSITLAKTKFDMLPIDEQDGKYPTGILKQDENAIEYTAAYEKVKEAHKNKTMVEI